MTDLIQSLTLKSFRDVLQAAGYRVEEVTDAAAGVSFLRSATSGLSFDIRLGSKLPGDAEGGHADVSLVALFNIVGELPLALVNDWNTGRRFGRLYIDRRIANQSFLVFSMDFAVAGGVTPRYLRTQVEIWDGLVQQLVPWLREELAKLAPVNGSGKPVATVSAEAAPAA
jgi:Putative bacterial sensory transduction regulator